MVLSSRIFWIETVKKAGYFSFSISTTYWQKVNFVFWFSLSAVFLRKSDQTFVPIIIGVNRPSELAFELESRPNPPRSRTRPLRPGPKLRPRPGYFNKLKLTQKNTYCSTEPLCAVLNWLWSWLRPLAKTQTKIQTRFWASNRKTQVIRPRPIPHILGLEGTPTQTVFPGI